MKCSVQLHKDFEFNLLANWKPVRSLQNWGHMLRHTHTHKEGVQTILDLLQTLNGNLKRNVRNYVFVIFILQSTKDSVNLCLNNFLAKKTIVGCFFQSTIVILREGILC